MQTLGIDVSLSLLSESGSRPGLPLPTRGFDRYGERVPCAEDGDDRGAAYCPRHRSTVTPAGGQAPSRTRHARGISGRSRDATRVTTIPGAPGHYFAEARSWRRASRRAARGVQPGDLPYAAAAVLRRTIPRSRGGARGAGADDGEARGGEDDARIAR